MTTVRDVLQFKDPRLMPVMAVIMVCLVIDFFGRLMLCTPASLLAEIEETASLSEAIPQIDQASLDSYLSKIAFLETPVMQNDSVQSGDDLAPQQPVSEPAVGYWRAGELSYKLVALMESSERFAVLNSLDNQSGRQEVVKLALGDRIVGYTVSEVLAKELRLMSDSGDLITLTLFEPEELQD